MHVALVQTLWAQGEQRRCVGPTLMAGAVQERSVQLCIWGKPLGWGGPGRLPWGDDTWAEI